MIRVLLIFVLLFVIAWAFWRFVDGVIGTFGGLPEKKDARRRGPAPMKLVRDPSCGTWVDPKASLALQAGGSVYHFCSAKCRDEFKRFRVNRIEEQLRADIVEAGRRMNARGYVASNDGNISVRLDDTRLLTTPKSVPKGFMTPDMMVIVNYAGEKLAGDRDPSSELPMHLEVYRNRPDVNAVVHAHPPIATGFAVAGIPLTKAVLAEVITTLGSIPIAEYGTPSTAELPAAVRKYIKAHDGMLLANHGAVTCGKDVLSAYYKMETIEHFAKISFVARMLGNENLISKSEVERLQGLRGMYGIAAPAPLCADPAEGDTAGDAFCQVLEAPESATERLVPDVSTMLRQASRDGEIRLTYGELTALITDAVRNLRD